MSSPSQVRRGIRRAAPRLDADRSGDQTTPGDGVTRRAPSPLDLVRGTPREWLRDLALAIAGVGLAQLARFLFG